VLLVFLLNTCLASVAILQPSDIRSPINTDFNDVQGTEGTFDFATSSYQNIVDYLIITSDVFVDDVLPLAFWKLQRGLIPAIETVENISLTHSGEDLPEQIRNCIRQFYEENNTQWVILAGGHPLVPTRLVKVGNNIVSCDQYYANLDDNWELNSDGSVSIIDYFDWENEVYVGRLSADNNEQMVELVSRLINYERSPPVGPWMEHALFGGAFAQFNSDANGNNVFDEGDYPEFDANRNHNWLKTDIFPSGWTSTLLGEIEGVKTSDYHVDKALTETNVIEEINNGVSAGMFDAHGSSTSMFRMIFSSDSDGDSLFDRGVDTSSSAPLISTSSTINTSGKYGFYFLCACSTGTFKSPGDSLSEYILRTAGIGCIASSGSAYYDNQWYNGVHGGWYTQGISSRFWEQLFSEGNNQPGKAFTRAKNDYVEDFLRLGGRKEGTNKTLIQYNLMGDPEVPVWTTIPSQLEYDILNVINRTILEISSDSQPISQVTVTLTNSTYYWREITSNEGTITLPVSSSMLSNLTLTISKINYLPIQEGSENTPASLPSMPNISSDNITTPSTNAPVPGFEISATFFAIISLLTLSKRKIRKI
jgi:hypothetical protein